MNAPKGDIENQQLIRSAYPYTFAAFTKGIEDIQNANIREIRIENSALRIQDVLLFDNHLELSELIIQRLTQKRLTVKRVYPANIDNKLIFQVESYPNYRALSNMKPSIMVTGQSQSYVSGDEFRKALEEIASEEGIDYKTFYRAFSGFFAVSQLDGSYIYLDCFANPTEH